MISPFQLHAAKIKYAAELRRSISDPALVLSLAGLGYGIPHVALNLYGSVLSESHFAMLQNAYVLAAILQMMKNFLFHSLQSDSSPLQSFALCTGTGHNCWVRNLCPLLLVPQNQKHQTPKSDSPEIQSPIHFVSLPLAHKGTPKC